MESKTLESTMDNGYEPEELYPSASEVINFFGKMAVPGYLTYIGIKVTDKEDSLSTKVFTNLYFTGAEFGKLILEGGILYNLIK